MATWSCPLCRVSLVGTRERTAHLANLHKRADDPTRCDNRLTPLETETPPLVTLLTPVNYLTPLGELARRPVSKTSAKPIVLSPYVHIHPPMCCKDFVAVQDIWDKYVHNVAGLCHPSFWRYFLHLHTLSAKSIDTALLAARYCFESVNACPKFPQSVRTLRRKIQTVPAFWSRVTHTTTIDISRFRLHVKSITFRFIDPIWAWIVAARTISPMELHWVPDTLTSARTGERLYGCGVQYGDAFRAACDSCPKDSYPMGLSLHWDGATSRGVTSAAICVGVANTNLMSPSTQFCVGYVPVVTGVGKKFYSSKKATELKFFVRNACATAILQVLATGAKHGVLCRLKNCSGKETRLFLFPRLMSMNFDQPEGQLFFGHLNSRCCTKCCRRNGYSCFRKSTSPTRAQVQILYDFVVGKNADARSFATAKLQRWGFNPLRRCCLLSHSFDKLLIRVPRWPQEVFPCVDYRDRMHGLLNQMYVKIVGAIDSLPLSGRDREVLDRRLFCVTRLRALRDPVTKRSYRLQQSLFSADGLTIVDKVVVLFLLPHILGPDAYILPEYARLPVLKAVARAQLCVIASRGRRAYTENELYSIFTEGYVVIFTNLETLYQVGHDKRYRDKLEAHLKDPENNSKPKAFERKTRSRKVFCCSRKAFCCSRKEFCCSRKTFRCSRKTFCCSRKAFCSSRKTFWYSLRCSDEDATDTADTTASMHVGGLGFYSHGDQSLTHHHWVRQVISSGSFGVHCTEAAEAALKGVFRHPLSRVRHAEQNVTHASMSDYLCHDLLYRALTPTFLPPKDVQHKSVSPGVSVPFKTVVAGLTQNVTMGGSFVTEATQQRFLHRDVRVAVVEILDLMCDKLGLPHTTVSYRLLQQLRWVIGQKFVCADGQILWATESDYQHSRGNLSGARHDCVRLVQTEDVAVQEGPTLVYKMTAQCCRIVSFWTVSGLSQFQWNLPLELTQRTHDGGGQHTFDTV